MSRIIKTESNLRDRNRLSRWIVFAIRTLMMQPEASDESKDLVAFIIICLQEIDHSIEASVVAWEKRGYWVKADRFRMQWQWAGKSATELQSSLEEEDWGKIVIQMVQLGQRFSTVKLPNRMKESPPWENAYQRLNMGKN
ncbi:MAG: hypothetical protein HPY76_03025 [Anaerolineae bacterium]|nr:hypothetical protein [Anaerolineae bacterium]